MIGQKMMSRILDSTVVRLVRYVQASAAPPPVLRTNVILALKGIAVEESAEYAKAKMT